jgi:hypothetical protein
MESLRDFRSSRLWEVSCIDRKGVLSAKALNDELPLSVYLNEEEDSSLELMVGGSPPYIQE